MFIYVKLYLFSAGIHCQKHETGNAFSSVTRLRDGPLWFDFL